MATRLGSRANAGARLGAFGPFAVALSLAFAARPASAVSPAPQLTVFVPVPLTVSGNLLSGIIDPPLGLHADLSVAFENPIGLTATSLDVYAGIANPLDPLLQLKLPPFGVSLSVGFPVIVRIVPHPGSTFAFEGISGLSLHILNLDFVPGSVFALYKSTGGEPFHDITTQLRPGSVRAGGTSGTFSDFMIVLDVRTLDTIIGEKFNLLQKALNDNAAAMPASVVMNLQLRLGSAKALWMSNDTETAVRVMDAFSSYVVSQSGTTIPDVWSPGGPANVAGILRSGAYTLRFSLSRKATGLP